MMTSKEAASRGAQPLVPLWLHRWHWFNLIILSDLLFIILRPMTLTGGSLAFLFPVFNYYAEKDTLFKIVDDRAVKSIYVLGVLDSLLVFYLLYAYTKHCDRMSFFLVCFFREVFVMSKTAIYVMYSYYFIIPSWRLFISAMNGSWVVIPFVCVVLLTSRTSARYAQVVKQAAAE